ncbi:muconolactone Delta-isomerase [Pontibacter roseus]|uniref:muconolactone Delta-isomerase n=1 Tax=Pontibacter roseus TaxID=336989 RepID=UPI000361A1EE|nr:muconolactone Delta-isomerase [Pontibacter roseus]
MLFHVHMIVNIPLDLDKAYVDDLKAKEKALSQELQRQGKWTHIWRIAGQYANISIFNVGSAGELHDLLMSLPLYPFMQVEVTALCQHYSSVKDEESAH